MSAPAAMDYVFQAVAGIEGLAICVINSVLIVAVLLGFARRKDMLIIAGLALAELAFGLGSFTLALYRIALMASNQSAETTTAWQCIVLPPVFLSYTGTQLVAIMFFFVCIDRFMAANYSSKYASLGTAYAAIIVGLVFLFGLISLATMLLSTYYYDLDLKPADNKLSRMCTDTLFPKWYGYCHYIISSVAGWLGFLVYVWIFITYKKKGQKIGPNSVKAPDEQHRLTVSLGYISLIIFLLFIIPTTITAVCFLLHTPAPLGSVLGLLTRISATVYARVYITRHADIKSGMGKVIKCKCNKSAKTVVKAARNDRDAVTLF